MWLASCGGSSSDTGTTHMRALNLTSDLASVDLFTDDVSRFSGVATDVVSASTDFTSGSYTVKVKRTGDGSALLTGTYSVAKDQHYTAVVWGRETALRLSTLPEDEDTANITTGNSRVRLFNATVDTGTVDVFLTASNTNLAEAAATQGSLTSGSLAGYRDISTGTYRLRVTGEKNPNDVRLDIPAVTLNEKTYNTIVLTAGAGGVLVNGTLPERRPLAKMPLTTAAIRDAERTLGTEGRVLVRWSGTESKLRVMVEGPSQAQIEKLAKGILGVATGELGR